MEEIYQSSEVVLRYIVEFSTLLLELFGICILVFSAIKSFVFWIRRDDSIRLQLAQGIALALEFKLGGEVLRTVVVREWAELGILGAIILLRATLTFLIHWEIKNEKKALAPKLAKKAEAEKKEPDKEPDKEPVNE
ncbi:MAG TPA: hypothetical protein DEO39_07480 [Clostridiales bacterium]|nr:hypothetical protein [Clostridiales bacterium]